MDTEQIFYKIGQVLLGCTIIGIIIISIVGLDTVVSMIPKCAFYSQTGFYCAGCGGTRAVISLLHGRFIQSCIYHPAVPYFAVNYIVFMVYEFLKTHFNMCRKRFPIEIMIYIGVAILLLQWIVKIILQWYFMKS